MANSSLSRANTSPSGNGYKYTFSAWIKRSKISDRQMFWRVLNPSATTYYSYMEFQADDRLHINEYSSNGTLDIVTSGYYRDTHAWYHVMGVVDTTQGTAGDRVKIYVNGSQVTALASSTLTLGQNQATTGTESGKTNYVGGDPANNTRFFNGYMSHVAFVDGQALTPTNFGETDSTSGVWKFKPPSGVTWGNNGFHLKFENSGNLGLDSSGETNNLTDSGNLKQSISTPSNIYNTLNTMDSGYASSTILNTANGGTTTMNTSGFGDYGVRTNLAVSKGKWYWECKNAAVNGAGGNTMGVLKMSQRLVQNIMSGSPVAGVYGIQRYNDSSINIHTNGSIASQNTAMFGGGITTSDIIGFALDMDNGKLYISKNGAYKDSSGNTGNPATQAYPTFTGLSTGEFYSFYTEIRMNNDNGLQVNFGEGRFGTTAISSAGSNGNGALFEYDVPSGFYALNTKNINTYG